MISYLNFLGEQASVELNPIGEMYCAFTYNDPKPGLFMRIVVGAKE